MDSSRYFIRFTFKDGTNYLFGESLTFRKIGHKVKKSYVNWLNNKNQFQICFAFLKGVILDEVERDIITDETIKDFEEDSREFYWVAFNSIFIFTYMLSFMNGIKF